MNKNNKNEEGMDNFDTIKDEAAVESESDTVVMEELLEK